MRSVLKLLAALLVLSVPALATIFGTVRGIAHDPQHRPVAGAHVALKAIGSLKVSKPVEATSSWYRPRGVSGRSNSPVMSVSE